MKTRDRILQCSLNLFNAHGEAHVSTLEIANELGISPGNLYYHFHGKDPIILELFNQFRDNIGALLEPPTQLKLKLDDYWLFLSLLVERMAQYRFLFQDLSNLAERQPKLGRGVRNWLNQLKRTLALMLAQLKAYGQLQSDTQALGQLVEQMCLTLLFSLDYQRIVSGNAQLRLVVYQVMMLVTPHLSTHKRTHAEQHIQGYLNS